MAVLIEVGVALAIDIKKLHKAYLISLVDFIVSLLALHECC